MTERHPWTQTVFLPT